MHNFFLYHLYKKLKAKIATALAGNPSKSMFVIGVTGTDGKSTTANLVHKILNDNLWPTALFSTINIKFGEEEIPNTTKITSFDPFLLQHYLSVAKSKWIKYVVVEVSSHAIHQHRIEGVDFDMGILTNITQEHLDYHKNFDEYVQTKKRFFLQILNNAKSPVYGVFPKDDEIGVKRFEEMPFDRSLSYGIVRKWNVSANNIKESLEWTEFEVEYLGSNVKVNSNLLGRFNVANILAATSAGLLLGVWLEDIKKSLESFAPLPWRMEVINHKDKTRIVDFAHTPNWLKNVLEFLTRVKWTQKVNVLFGAPGQRDPYKRPQMAKIVQQYADNIVLTSDDPAGENRFKILKDVKAGFDKQSGKKFWINPHRQKAIKLIDLLAQKWDIVLLAGKWHEKKRVENWWAQKRDEKQRVLEV